MTPTNNSQAPATCQVLTVGCELGGGAALHIAGMEINLSLSDTLRISRLLFEVLEEMADRALIVEMNAEIEAKEDHKPFTLEWPASGGKGKASAWLDLPACDAQWLVNRCDQAYIDGPASLSAADVVKIIRGQAMASIAEHERARLRSISGSPLAPEDAREAAQVLADFMFEAFRENKQGAAKIKAAHAAMDKILNPYFPPLVPAPLVWTKEKPKVAGWYWYRNEGSRTICDVYMAVFGFLAHMNGAHVPASVKQLDGEWAGPIPQPGSNTPKGAG